jgi:hypothetical protein
VGAQIFAPWGMSQLLARVEQALRVERPLDFIMQLERSLRPLQSQRSVLDETKSVLA